MERVMIKLLRWVCTLHELSRKVHRVSEKTVQNSVCQYFVNFLYILIIFGS